MKVALITLQEDLDCYGLRCLSSVLKANGVETKLVFLGRMSQKRGNVRLWNPDAVVLDRRHLDRLVDVCSDVDLIGFSVLTLYYHESCRVADYIRQKLDKPVIWGGIHPTIRPEECLDHANIVAFGEAEDTIVEVAERLGNGKSLEGVPGIWFRSNGSVVQNPIRQPPHELDRFPFPDVSVDGHYVFYNDKLRPLTEKIYMKKTEAHYMSINARGCHLRCTYCCNSQFARLFDWKILRYKSVPRLIGELKRVKKLYPQVTGIKLSDDDFGDLSTDYIRAFAESYKKEIGLPLGIPGFCARNLTEEKLEPLLDGGLVYIRLGIQSGSPRIRKLYGRHETDEEIVQAVKLVNKHMDRIERLKLDMITDNPWETEEDVIQSIRLLLKLPKPYVMTVFSLTLLPGTPLHKKAVREGILEDEKSTVYGKHFYNFDARNSLNRILSLFSEPVVMKDRIEALLAASKDEDAFEREYAQYVSALKSHPSNRRPLRFW